MALINTSKLNSCLQFNFQISVSQRGFRLCSGCTGQTMLNKKSISRETVLELGWSTQGMVNYNTAFSGSRLLYHVFKTSSCIKHTFEFSYRESSTLNTIKWTAAYFTGHCCHENNHFNSMYGACCSVEIILNFPKAPHSDHLQFPSKQAILNL